MGVQINIHEFKTRYRLSTQTRDSRARLDRILQEIVDEALDQALTELGISASEELCIREINSLVHLRLQDSDQKLLEHWSRALVAAIETAIAKEDHQQLVRYRSRLHAVIDFASGVAYQRLQRAWAWRQLGFIDSEVGLSPSHATDQLVAHLATEPQLILPVIAQMAAEGRLLALAQKLAPIHWQQLSQAVAAIAIDKDAPESAIQAFNGPMAEAAMIETAHAQWSRSQLAQALINHPQSFIEQQAPLASLAVLISAEIEPALFLRPQAWLTQWLTVLARQLVSLQPALAVLAGDWLGGTADNNTIPVNDNAHAEGVESAISYSNEQNGSQGRQPESVHEASANTSVSETQDTNLSANEEAMADSLLDELPGLVGPEQLATEWGGLFFLYNIIDELALPQRLMADTKLLNRPLGWLLQGLVEAILPELDDADVVKVFAGVDIDAPAPWLEDAPMTAAEREALNAYGVEICTTLQQRLQCPGETAAMLNWICRRPARLSMEPAWLSVNFALDELDTEIRRAALDFNPGYLPWLARVVEIRYE